MINSRRNWRAARLACAAFVACALGSGGCAETTAPDSAPDVRAWVVGEAARSLGPDGRFVFPEAVIQTPYPVINESRARELALAYVRTFASLSTFWRPLELQHEGSIDVERLQPAPRVEYAESVYEPLPDSYSDAIRRAFGPAFLVRLLVGSVPTVHVTVSVYATEIQIRDGKVITGGSAGGTFEALGTPRTYGYSKPISPELATVVIGEATGLRIELIPSLSLPSWEYSAAFAKWKLTLERTASFRGVESGRVYNTRTVYVGVKHIEGVPGGNPAAVFVPLDTQPQVDTVGGNPPWYLRVRAASPVLFEEVSASFVSFGKL